MTHRQLVEYLRTSSALCRLYADTASDAEAAQTLRQVADKMEIAVLALENPDETGSHGAPRTVVGH